MRTENQTNTHESRLRSEESHFSEIYTIEDIKRTLPVIFSALSEIKAEDYVFNTETVSTGLRAAYKRRFSSEIENVLYQRILGTLVNAERDVPFGYTSTLRVLSKITRNITSIGIPLEPMKSDIKAFYGLSTTDMYQSFSEKHGMPESIAQLCNETIKISGYKGRILIKDDYQVPYDSIELKSGYIMTYEKLAGAQNSTQVSPAVLICDGFIESVSEIDTILQQCYASSIPITIFCRGAADDVLSTFSLNNAQGKLHVNCFKVPYDLYGVNSLNDIAMICGSDVISSLKGDLLSTKNLSHLPLIEKIEVSGNNVSLYNTRTESSIIAHRETLIQKMNDVIPGTEEFIESRIAVLAPRTVIVRFNKNLTILHRKAWFDFGLRLHIAAMKNGIHKNEYDEIVPVRTTISSLRHSYAFLDWFKNLGAVIVKSLLQLCKINDARLNHLVKYS